MSQKVPVRCCGDIRYASDSSNCFIFQRIFYISKVMKFTGILFDVSQGLLTVKTA